MHDLYENKIPFVKFDNFFRQSHNHFRHYTSNFVVVVVEKRRSRIVNFFLRSTSPTRLEESCELRWGDNVQMKMLLHLLFIQYPLT